MNIFSKQIIFIIIFLGISTKCFADYEKKLVASDAGSSDQFGYSVDISGDYIISGAPYDDDDGTDSGSAYIFVRNGASWTQQAKLTASDGAAGDNFGYSVSIDGDYAIIGTLFDDDDGNDSGSAYIFNRTGASWTQQAKLTASDGAADDNFGYSVAIDGNYAIIGTPFDDDSGSAYIFNRSGSTWSQQAKLNGDSTAVGDAFGYSVSISGDSVIIGAPFDDLGSDIDVGSYYIFSRSGVSWNQNEYIAPYGAGSNQLLGARVSIHKGNISFALSINTGGLSYLGSYESGIWNYEQLLLGNVGDYAIVTSLYENYVVVGAPQYGSTSTGKAFIVKDGSLQRVLTASDSTAGDIFGESVSINGNYVVVGSRGDDSYRGSIYVYSVSPFVNGDVSQTVNGNSTYSFNETNEDTGMDIAFTGVSGSASIQCESFPEAPTGTDGISGTVQPVRWVITDGGLTFANAEIRIDTSALPISLPSPSTASIYHRSTPGSGTFTQLATSLVGSELVANTASFSEFTIGGGDGSLPVELTNFGVEPVSNGIKLFWETETETNNLGFKIYRSRTENGEFKTIASHSTDEKLRGQINSTFPTNYSWIDQEVENGKKYFYFISDIDLNGNEVKHRDKMVSVTTNFSDNPEIFLDYVLEQNFPNPFNPSTTINFQIAKEQNVKLEVYNLIGELVKELVNEEMGKGSHSAIWNGTDSFGKAVSSGTYFYKISAGTFIQTNKMILLK